jgi:prepilin-type processing-associated H-X9-DG protein
MNNGRQLIHALYMYATDSQDFLPPNPDQASANAWIEGDMEVPAEATNSDFLIQPKTAKLSPYGATARVYKCPADLSAHVRTFSMNQSVGTLPAGGRVNGPWLDGTGHHTSAHPWRTFGRFGEMQNPAPTSLWVFIDEEEHSINDGAFAVSMTTPTEWIDWPGTYHNFACGVAFADGHSEIHKWQDPRTRVVNGALSRRAIQPNNADIVWLQQHTSSKQTTLVLP